MPAPIAKLDPAAKWHPDTDTAATELFKGFDPKSAIEQAGVFYNDGTGKHSYSAPVGQDQDNFALRAQVQKGHSISGIYHNHPGSDSNAAYFSPNDIAVANQLKVPSYIMFSDGSVRKYVPGQTKTQSIQDGSRISQTVAKGDPVVAQPPADDAVPTLPVNIS